MIVRVRVLSVRLLGLIAGVVVASAVCAQQASPEDIAARRTNSAKIHTELGSMYFQDGNVAVALEELKLAIEIDPAYAAAYSVRALVHHYLKETSAAEEDFQRAIRLNSDDPDFSNNYGWFLCQIGREKDGIDNFMKAIKNPLYKTPERAYANAGLCAANIGDLKSAEDYLLKAARPSAQPNPFVKYKLGEVYYKLGRLPEARAAVADAIRQSEPSPEVLLLAYRIENQAGDRAAEANYANQLRRKFPQSKEYQELLKGKQE